MDWNGLLKWSLKYQDGTEGAPPLSEERAEFLRGAIREYLATVEDPNKTVQDATRVVSESIGKDTTVTQLNLDMILQCIEEDPEVARNLPKLGVVDPLLDVLERGNAAEVKKVLKIWGSAAQNNEVLQNDLARRDGVLQRFLVHLDAGSKEPEPAAFAVAAAAAIPSESTAMVAVGPKAVACETDAEAEEVQVATMSALSGIVRSNGGLQEKFNASNGVAALRKVFQMVISGGQEISGIAAKMQVKGFNMMKSLLVEGTMTAKQAAEEGLVGDLINLLENRENLGLEYGESLAEVVGTLADQLKAGGDKLSAAALGQAVQGRIDWLKTLPPDSVKRELEQLQKAAKVLTFATKVKRTLSCLSRN